jgi:F0F1-type ATP synthase delta subunit
MDRRLPDNVATPQQVQLLRIEAESLAAAIGEGARRSKDKPLAKVSADLQAILGKSKITAELLEQTAAWLSQQQTAPVVHFVLPVLPQPELRQRLVAWLRDNLAPNLLASFEHNSGLAGGFVIRTGSVIYDFSFRRKLLDGAAGMKKVMKKVTGV